MSSIQVYCIFALQNCLSIFIPKEIIMFIVSMMFDRDNISCGSKFTTFMIGPNIYIYCDDNNILHSRKKIIKKEKFYLIKNRFNGTVAITQSQREIYIWDNRMMQTLDMNYKKFIFDSTSKIISADSGYAHTIVLTEFGEIYGWGYNTNGQLGLGLTHIPQSDSPQRLSIKDVKLISCGKYHTIILTKTECFVCGLNGIGQLGLGHRYNSYEFQKINLRNIISVACGNHYTIALALDDIYTWGVNTQGQLGLGYTNAFETIP